MPTGRRLTTLLIVSVLVILPAAGLRALCIGNSCTSSEAATSTGVPFCSLPRELRSAIAAGFREDRSPDALAVGASDSEGVSTRTHDDVEVPWPSVPAAGSSSSGPSDPTRVPIAFAGAGFRGRPPAAGTGLDQIAPTLEAALGFQRDHPEVRAGTSAPGVVERPRRPVDAPFVVEIVWKSVDSASLEARPEAWPFLRAMVEAGGTLDGTTGSLPIDPAATLTTIGTGGLPSQHGITGSLLRGDAGVIVPAWSPRAPGSVIASFADDLDEADRHATRIGGVLSARSDRGLVGDGWYPDAPRDDDVTVTDRTVDGVRDLLDSGYGTDGNAGFIGVVVRNSVPAMDRITRGVVELVRTRVPGASIVVTATGADSAAGATSSSDVAAGVDARLDARIVAADGSGGLFLDREVSGRRSITANAVAAAMAAARGPGGAALFADAFPSFAVAFSRFC